jgi:dCTP deaminase
MILSDFDILKEIDLGNIVCTPFDRRNVSNSSIDLRLGQYIAEQKKRFHTVKFETDDSGQLTVIDPIKPRIYNLLDQRTRDAHKFVLKPGQFVLAQTLELVGSMSDSIECKISDKSTLARTGLSVCFSAGKIEPGNILIVTLEIKNHGHNPIELQYGMHCCQISFHQLTSPVCRKYSGKYLNSHNLELAK